jgi:hypothetical protein
MLLAYRLAGLSALGAHYAGKWRAQCGASLRQCLGRAVREPWPIPVRLTPRLSSECAPNREKRGGRLSALRFRRL